MRAFHSVSRPAASSASMGTFAACTTSVSSAARACSSSTARRRSVLSRVSRRVASAPPPPPPPAPPGTSSAASATSVRSAPAADTSAARHGNAASSTRSTNAAKEARGSMAAPWRRPCGALVSPAQRTSRSASRRNHSSHTAGAAPGARLLREARLAAMEADSWCSGPSRSLSLPLSPSPSRACDAPVGTRMASRPAAQARTARACG
jgi:hypothetical protein